MARYLPKITNMSIVRTDTSELTNKDLEKYIDLWGEFIADLVRNDKICNYSLTIGVEDIVAFAKRFYPKRFSINFKEIRSRIDRLRTKKKYGVYLLALQIKDLSRKDFELPGSNYATRKYTDKICLH